MPDKMIPFSVFTELRHTTLSGLSIAHCHGVFDLLHIGHIKHLSAAKAMADILVVSVTPDHYVNKGPGRPAFSIDLRMEALAALSVCDYVLMSAWPTAIEAIERIQPQYYVKGQEYAQLDQDITGNIDKERKAVEAVKGELVFTQEVCYSSSHLLNQFYTRDDACGQFLQHLRAKYSAEHLLSAIDKLSGLKVLVVGESIIDHYVYCDTMGKSGKDPVLSSLYRYEEVYAGGVLAIANHVASLCDQVTVLSSLGEEQRQDKVITEKLQAHIKPIFVRKPGAPTLTKKRFVERTSGQKLFELYEMCDQPLPVEAAEAFYRALIQHCEHADVVIVADYGHGLMTSECRAKLSSQARFLAINTQANAANLGFNVVSKYAKADLVCIAKRELQLNARSTEKDHDLMLDLSKTLQTQLCLVTCGAQGSKSYSAQYGFNQAPALTDCVSDAVGAGDAVLSVSALLCAMGVEDELIALVANLVGAENVGIMGNKAYLNKQTLLKQISHILK